MTHVRYTRQVRLVEVGGAGQARLEKTVATVDGDGLSARVCARYLESAGVHVTRVPAVEPPSRIPPWVSALDPSARAVAAGAYAALSVMRAALFGDAS